jgi:hypothetical protein
MKLPVIALEIVIQSPDRKNKQFTILHKVTKRKKKETLG